MRDLVGFGFLFEMLLGLFWVFLFSHPCVYGFIFVLMLLCWSGFCWMYVFWIFSLYFVKSRVFLFSYLSYTYVCGFISFLFFCVYGVLLVL